MPKLLEGKAGLITGAASGIGRAGAIAFATEGAKVIVSDINQAGGEETVRLVREAGGEAQFFKCDVTDEAQVKNLINYVVSKYGKLDWAFNNAGISITVALADTKTEDWDLVIKTNLYGYYYCMKYEIGAMLKTGGGAIVNTGSDAGVVSTPYGAAYGTSKFAITGLTQCAALDYARMGIRINSIGPGITDTAMISAFKESSPEIMQAILDSVPTGRMGRAEEAANAALFLLSDMASHITATHLLVDGGQFAKL